MALKETDAEDGQLFALLRRIKFFGALSIYQQDFDKETCFLKKNVNRQCYREVLNTFGERLRCSSHRIAKLSVWQRQHRFGRGASRQPQDAAGKTVGAFSRVAEKVKYCVTQK